MSTVLRALLCSTLIVWSGTAIADANIDQEKRDQLKAEIITKIDAQQKLAQEINDSLFSYSKKMVSK